MKTADLTWEQLNALSDHWQQAAPEDRAALAGAFDSSEGYLTRMLQFFRAFEDKRQAALPSPLPPAVCVVPPPQPSMSPIPNFPPSQSKLWTDAISITTDNAIIISDVELPDYDAALMRLMVALAMRHGIKTLVIGGDFFAFDKITPWPEIYESGDETLLRSELRIGETVIQKCREWFDEIYAVMGNHDRRFSKLTGGQLGPFDFMGVSIRPIVKPYAHLYIETKRGRILVVHPKNYSSVQLTIPTKLFNLEPVRCSVISAHTHHLAIGHPLPGAPYQVAESGCMRDPARTKYKNLNKTLHPAWVPGFAAVIDGYIKIFPKETTNWECELGPELYAAAQEKRAA